VIMHRSLKTLLLRIAAIGIAGSLIHGRSAFGI